MPSANGTIVIEDYGGEISTTGVNLQDVNPAGSNYGSVTQDLDEIKDGLIMLITAIIRHALLNVKFPESSAPVTDPNAQRELKWLITYTDTTQYLGTGNTVENPGFNKPFSFEVACPDLSLLPDANTDKLDLTDVTVAAAIALIEPNIRSPYNRAVAAGITPTNRIDEIRLVGRNI